MRRIRTMGLGLVAVFAICALGAGSASAASPEYKTCIKVTTGAEFASKTCEGAAATGKGYKLAEWNQGKKTEFKAKSASPKQNLVKPCIQAFDLASPAEKEAKVHAKYTEACLAHAAVGFFEATSSKAKGKLTGPKTSTFVEEFKGVKANGTTPCNSPGQGKGKIKTNELEGTLVPLPGGKVGELIKAVGGGLLAEFSCGGVENKVKGAVLAEVKGLSGPAAKEFILKVSAAGGNGNNLQEFLYLPGTGEMDKEGNPAGSEDDGIDPLAFAQKKGECELEKTEAECGGLVGGEFFAEESYAPPGTLPITLLTEIPAKKITAPANQNGESHIKGEVLKVV
jgi:hypothetical protein